ncbi:hypothetical protein [Vibrio tapetis]|uniref:Uncharacterized protein n=1 Tax=Vibrio tapetis subsp. tapetis TaxID=1671868 RepID=A0A2N8ZNC5_9VIBR|nr:hypothetical protein [Vibrio tapetis]SON53421.1 conserved protein of unknown function [Vibrio tapetis subsp. tapetis]
MLRIMYGILPLDSQLMLGDMTEKKQCKNLVGFSFQDNAIINVKFIADTAEGLIFAALIVPNSRVNSPSFHGRIESIQIDDRQCRFSTVRSQLAIHLNRIPITRRKPTRKSNRIKGETQWRSNSGKKRFRKEKNLTLSKRNWKQFVRKRKSVVSLYLKNKAMISTASV